MRTGRPKQPLTLSAEERERLESLAHRARILPLLARRARIVLACAARLDNKNLAPTVASLAGHGGKVARPIPAGQAGRTLRRAAARRSPHRQRCPSRTRRGANFGKHAAWRNALEHPRFSASDRTKPHDHQPHLARLRSAAASE